MITDSSLVPLFVPVGPEMLIILAIIILLFGANKIPKLARATGQSISEFQRGREESEAKLNDTKSSRESGTEDFGWEGNSEELEEAEPKR